MNMGFVNNATPPPVFTGGYDDEMDLPEYGEPSYVPVKDTSSNERSELAEKEFEKNANDMRLRSARWEGQDRWQGKENEEMRKVNVIHCNEFIRRLAASGINAALDNHCVDDFCADMNKIHPERDYEIIGDGGPRIWLNSFSRVGRIGVNAWLKPKPGTKAWDKHLYIAETVTTLQYPWSYEWSVMRFDEYNVPTAEKFRGWRTTLLNMIIKGVLTEEQAHRAFPLHICAASTFYRKQLYNFRNRLPVQGEEAFKDGLEQGMR